jgi:polysaccharide biosynthesis/export protein
MFRSACILLLTFASATWVLADAPDAPTVSGSAKQDVSKTDAVKADASKGDATKAEVTKADAAKGDYVLQPQDLIRVQVFQEDELNREVRLSQESSVNLPLIGNVDLKGKTARQAEEKIRAAYDRDYLVNPQVNLFVLEYAKRYVNVLGAVGNSGPVIFPPEEGLTLIEAITRAGGFARIADKKHVTLKRTNADGTTEPSIINADDIMKGRTDESCPLQPNDTIFVPEIIF